MTYNVHAHITERSRCQINKIAVKYFLQQINENRVKARQ